MNLKHLADTELKEMHRSELDNCAPLQGKSEWKAASEGADGRTLFFK
jgi:hypothetical protein